MKKTCKDCGASFTLSQGELDFYQSKNLSIPARCKNCRDNRKKSNTDYEKPYVQRNVPTGRNVPGRSSRSEQKKITILVSALLFVLYIPFSFIFNTFFSNDDASPNISTSSPYDVTVDSGSNNSSTGSSLQFRYDSYLSEHFAKHGSASGHSSEAAYLAGANAVIQSSSVLRRTQSDGDTAYYLEASNEFVVVSTDNYIRTYFKPNDGIDYFNRQ